MNHEPAPTTDAIERLRSLIERRRKTLDVGSLASTDAPVLAQMREHGRSTAWLAQELHIAPQVVRETLQDAGLWRPQARRLYQTWQDLPADLDAEWGRLRARRRAVANQRARLAGGKGRPPLLGPDDAALLRQALGEVGGSVHRLAAQIGVASPTVFRALHLGNGGL